MKKNLQLFAIISIGLVFILIGVLICFYPEISNYINQKNQSFAIKNYETYVAEIKEKDYTSEIELAQKYNDALFDIGNIRHAKVETLKGSDIFGKYNEILNVNKDGIIGVVKIPKIDVELPIYHGTEGPEVTVAVGHMPHTSFPIGTTNSHVGIAGHTAMANAKLFTDLDQLKIDDKFYISVLNQEFEYTVDDIRIVEPEEYDCLNIVEGKEYVTLITCTPTGVNSHRLLVRGYRSN